MMRFMDTGLASIALPRRRLLAVRILWAFLFACCLSFVGADPIDLPYDSPSTGADGALTIPDTMPLWHRRDFPLRLVFDENRGHFLAIGSRTDNFQDLSTVGLIDGQWLDLDIGGDFEAASLVYDATRGETIRFGGRGSFNYENRLWIWSGEGWEFRRRAEGTLPPPSRGNAAMAYDAARQVVVLFGGENDDGELGDTWTWDGSAWTEIAPAASPSPRTHAAMAYDAARQEVVLFGGDDGSWLDDTWVWDGANWTEKSPSATPPDRSPAMAYDSSRSVVVLLVGNYSDEMETWEWDGSDWTQRTPANSPPFREFHDIEYSPDTGSIHLYNGRFDASGSDLFADSWQWDGSDWTQTAVSPTYIDMSSKPDGIWNYTSIDIGRTEIRFLPNPANTPVVWLATDDVRIEAALSLGGADGYAGRDAPVNTPAPGGPGGFAGGLGGFYETADGSNASGFPGSGPGGGVASLIDAPSGEGDGHHGQHFGIYGVDSLQGLVGGSGGGGAATTSFSESNEWGRGGNGGGGGGAILIATSKNLFLEGRILASGGEGGLETFKRSSSSVASVTSAGQGGAGAGGSIRLVADRILGSGFLETRAEVDFGHDHSFGPENNGRIRIETFYHRIFWDSQNHSTIAFPKASRLGADAPLLVVDSIAGQGVSATPSGDPSAPEVVFSETGPVAIEVAGQNVPDGTLVRLRVTSGPEVIEPDAAALSGGAALFEVAVPAGAGTVVAFADWETTP